MVLLPTYATGAAKRKSPVAGFPYGIPRYSETSVAIDAGWPWTGPLEVSTVLPICQFLVPVGVAEVKKAFSASASIAFRQNILNI